MSKLDDMGVVVWHECDEDGYAKDMLEELDKWVTEATTKKKGKKHDKK